MSIDGVLLAAIKNDLEKKIIGARIDKIYQPEKQIIKLTLRQGGENLDLLLSSDPSYARVQITKKNFKNPVSPPNFCMLLRKYLMRGIIKKIEQPDFERIITLQIELRNNTFFLIIEIMGRHSNIVLVSKEGEVLDAIKRINSNISRERQLYPGIKYKYPPRQDKLNPLLIDKQDFFSKIGDFNQEVHRSVMYNFRGIGPYMAKEIANCSNINFNSNYNQLNVEKKEQLWESFNYFFTLIKQGDFSPTVGINKGSIVYLSAYPYQHINTAAIKTFTDTSQMLDFYFDAEIKDTKLDVLRNNLLNTVSNFQKKNSKRRKELKNKLNDAQNAEHYKQMGELITASIYQLKKGMTEAEVTNYFDPEQNKITIILDPKLSPSDNAQRYFKKYSKAKKSIVHLKKQLGIFRHEDKYLAEVQHNIEQAETREDLNEIREELKEEGYIKEKQRGRIKNREKPLPPHHFKSTHGFDIYVGRNNKQNDYLTKKMANRQDLWLHIKDLPGSHVIIKNNTSKELPEETILEAAIIAAYYSKGQMSENVPIDYTEVKNVNKPKGAKPGLVYYENYNTVYVHPDVKLIKNLKE